MAAFLGLAIASCPVAWAKEATSVYYPSIQSAQERQELLRGGLAKSNFDVTVFAKFKDFADEVKSKGSNIVLAPAFFQKYHPDYTPVLGFSDRGGRRFKYVLLSLSNKWNKGNLMNGKIGLVEEVDRDHLKDLVSDLLSVNCKMIKSVSKPEDLFPLLVFKSADFIMVSPENHERLKEKFTTKVFQVSESISVENPMVFVKNGTAPDDVVKAFQMLPPDLLKTLGFASMEPIGKIQ
jgi:hypothetical protein